MVVNKRERLRFVTNLSKGTAFYCCFAFHSYSKQLL